MPEPARTPWRPDGGGEPLVCAIPTDPQELGTPPTSSAPLAVWVTGTGTPVVVPDRAGPSTLLRSGEDVIVVDCGNGTAYQLAKLGVRLHALTHIFITHHHVDHNIDLPYLLLSPWVQRRKGPYTPPTIIGPPGTLDYVNRALHAQEYDLRVRIPHGYHPHELAPRVIELDDDITVHGKTWSATAFRVNHMPVDQAFGYRFDGRENSVVISGDTTPCDNLIRHARGADVLIHEVLYPGFGIPEYHTLSTDVGKIATAADVKRLVLTHLIPGDLEDEKWLAHVEQDYTGPVAVGHDLLQVL